MLPYDWQCQTDSHLTANLDKTKVTGISQVDAAQDKVHGTATSTLLGQDSVAAPVADLASREGINRIERRGKDEQGNYVPFAAPGESYAEGAGQKVGEGLKGATTMMPRIGIGKKQ